MEANARETWHRESTVEGAAVALGKWEGGVTDNRVLSGSSPGASFRGGSSLITPTFEINRTYIIHAHITRTKVWSGWDAKPSADDQALTT